MQPTSASLLQRLRDDPVNEDWRRLVDMYTPFIRHWLRDPALAADAEDLLQDILEKLVRKLPGFDRQRNGSFRAWLRTITVNRVKDWKRRRRIGAAGGTDHVQAMQQLEDPNSGLSQRWDREHDSHVLGSIMGTLRGEFSDEKWAIFHRLIDGGDSAATVAADTGKSVNAVLLIKSRILARVRQEAEGLL